MLVPSVKKQQDDCGQRISLADKTGIVSKQINGQKGRGYSFNDNLWRGSIHEYAGNCNSKATPIQGDTSQLPTQSSCSSSTLSLAEMAQRSKGHTYQKTSSKMNRVVRVAESGDQQSNQKTQQRQQQQSYQHQLQPYQPQRSCQSFRLPRSNQSGQLLFRSLRTLPVIDRICQDVVNEKNGRSISATKLLKNTKNVDDGNWKGFSPQEIGPQFPANLRAGSAPNMIRNQQSTFADISACTNRADGNKIGDSNLDDKKPYAPLKMGRVLVSPPIPLVFPKLQPLSVANSTNEPLMPQMCVSSVPHSVGGPSNYSENLKKLDIPSVIEQSITVNSSPVPTSFLASSVQFSGGSSLSSIEGVRSIRGKNNPSDNIAQIPPKNVGELIQIISSSNKQTKPTTEEHQLKKSSRRKRKEGGTVKGKSKQAPIDQHRSVQKANTAQNSKHASVEALATQLQQKNLQVKRSKKHDGKVEKAERGIVKDSMPNLPHHQVISAQKKGNIGATISQPLSSPQLRHPVGSRIGDGYVLSETVVERTEVVPKKVTRQYTVDKFIVVPETRITEEIIDQTEVVKERIVEVSCPVVRETVIEVNQNEYVDTLIKELPDETFEAHKINVETTDTRENIIPKFKLIEKEHVVEVPDIEYRQIDVERVVEVPEIYEEIVYIEKKVPQYVQKPYPVYKDVPIETIIERMIPVPMSHTTNTHFELQDIEVEEEEEDVKIYVPRFIEIACPVEHFDDETVEEMERYSASLTNLMSSVPGAAMQTITTNGTNGARSDPFSKLCDIEEFAKDCSHFSEIKFNPLSSRDSVASTTTGSSDIQFGRLTARSQMCSSKKDEIRDTYNNQQDALNQRFEAMWRDKNLLM